MPEAPVTQIDRLIARMVALLEPLDRTADPRRFFLGTYLRTTNAVKDELARSGFVDGEWTERWGHRLRRSLPRRGGAIEPR